MADTEKIGAYIVVNDLRINGKRFIFAVNEVGVNMFMLCEQKIECYATEFERVHTGNDYFDMIQEYLSRCCDACKQAKEDN